MSDQFMTMIAEALEKDGSSMSMGDRFKEYDEWDSLAVLAVMAAVEESYGTLLSRHDLNKCDTLQDLFAVIRPGNN